MMSKHHIILNCTMNDLMQDIRATEDPIRKIILKKFLDLKSREMMAASEDPSLDGISDTEYVDDKLEKEIVQKIDAPKKVRQIKKMLWKRLELYSKTKQRPEIINKTYYISKD